MVKTETKTYKHKISGLFCDMCAKELGDDIILASTWLLWFNIEHKRVAFGIQRILCLTVQ